MLQTIIDFLPIGVALFETDWQVSICNARFRRLFDLPDAMFEGRLPTLNDLVKLEKDRGSPGRHAHQLLVQRLAVQTGGVQRCTLECPGPDGTALEVCVEPVPGSQGFVALYTEVAKRAAHPAGTTDESNDAGQRLRESEAFYRLLTEDVRDVAWKLDRELRFTYISPADELLRGYRADEVVGHHVFEMFTPEGVAAVTEIMHQRQEAEQRGIQTGAITFEAQHHCKDGRLLWGEIFSKPDRDEHGMITGFHGITREITERKLMEEQVRQLAFYDTLTNLPNRRLLNDRISQCMAASERSGEYAALMFLDLDNFKPLNDRHGHEVGDLLLIEAAERISHCVRETDTVARIGGDEFVVMLTNLQADKAHATAQAQLLADKIRTALSESYLLSKNTPGFADAAVKHRCTASIGVALFIGHQASPEKVLNWADAAMYAAKDGGRNSIRFHAPNP